MLCCCVFCVGPLSYFQLHLLFILVHLTVLLDVVHAHNPLIQRCRSLTYPTLCPTSCLVYLVHELNSGAEDHFKNTRDGQVDLWRNTAPAYGENNTDFSTYLYTKEFMRILDDYSDTTQTTPSTDNNKPPLFVYMAYQSTHGPLQVPQNWTDIYNISYKPRLLCQGMISAVDASIGAIVSRLHDMDLFNNSLIIFSSDNGGPHDHANNYPLRGSKGSNFEGGVRVCAFINGGIVPEAARGQSLSDGLMHITDWYATLGSLAGYNGTEDAKAAAAGLPAVDSVDQWKFLTSVTASGPSEQCPRTNLMLSGSPTDGGALIGQYPDPASANGDVSLFKLIRFVLRK